MLPPTALNPREPRGRRARVSQHGRASAAKDLANIALASLCVIGLVRAQAACQLRQARSFFVFPERQKGLPATPLGQRGEVATAGGELVAGASVLKLVKQYRPEVLKV